MILVAAVLASYTLALMVDGNAGVLLVCALFQINANCGSWGVWSFIG